MRSGYQRIWWPLAIAGVQLGCAVVATLLITRFSTTEWFSFACVIVVLIASTIGVLFFNAFRGKDAFSPLSLIAWFYLLAFGIGGIYYWVVPNPADALFAFPRFSHADLTKATALGTVAFLLLVAGYAWNPFSLIARRIGPLRIGGGRPSEPWFVIVPLLAIGWLARVMLIVTGHYFHIAAPGIGVVSTGYTWFLATCAVFPTLATAYLGAQSSRATGGTPREAMRWAFWVLVLVEFAWNLPSGARSGIVGLALMILVVRYYGRQKRIPWIAATAVGVLVVFFVFPVVSQYRGQSSDYETNSRSALGQAVDNYATLSPTTIARRGIDATVGRFSDVAAIAVVFNQGRQQMRLDPGETLVWGIEAFVPRAVFSKKADQGLFGNEFGQAFNLTFGPSSRGGTSIALGQPTELYLNFGLLGVVFGMPFVGALFRLVSEYLRERQRDAAVLALYAVLAWPIIGGQEVILAVGVVGTIKGGIFLALTLILLNRFSRALISGEREADVAPA